jgi:hypothetical protein
MDEARRVRRTIKKQRRRLVEQRLGESRVAPNALDYCLPESASQCHAVYLLPFDVAAPDYCCRRRWWHG